MKLFLALAQCCATVVSKLVETFWQAEKWLKGPKRQKSFCGFADVELGCCIQTVKIIDANNLLTSDE